MLTIILSRCWDFCPFKTGKSVTNLCGNPVMTMCYTYRTAVEGPCCLIFLVCVHLANHFSFYHHIFFLTYCSSSLTSLFFCFLPFCSPHFTAPNSANADFANFDAFGQSSGTSSFGAFAPASQTPSQPLSTGSLSSILQIV